MLGGCVSSLLFGLLICLRISLIRFVIYRAIIFSPTRASPLLLLITRDLALTSFHRITVVILFKVFFSFSGKFLNSRTPSGHTFNSLVLGALIRTNSLKASANKPAIATLRVPSSAGAGSPTF
uniref:Uncharacterized protein n=1 Tax=Ixodes ricinus TaxID=34613 RepID=A0A6B0UNL8_IXORI